ncbi:MAG: dTMP kinase [Firmicutes bacterium]|jgi:dTMP kinase|nr:dTMP kinase [Bacillota bacterium]NBI64722.1 dTMP kinase [Clostridiales bacterium]
MKQGLFITLEGMDGAGKSTQITAIRKLLETKGHEVIVTREPGGTAISEKIREIILDRENAEMDPMTEALLYAAARAQHVTRVIQPALEQGTHVVCDRFIDSSVAYQGYGRGLGDSVSIINAYAAAGCVPDITFFLRLEPDVSKGRIQEGSLDRIELEAMDFHQRVFHGYEELALQFPERIITIDAAEEISAVSETIREHIERLL